MQTYAQIVSSLSTGVVATLKTPPTAPRIVVVNTAGVITIELSYGGNTLLLFTMNGSVAFPNAAIYNPSTNSFTVTGFADTCVCSQAGSALVITVGYVDSVDGSISEVLRYPTPNIGAWDITLNYITNDTIYKVNQASEVNTVSGYTNPSVSYMNFATNPATGKIVNMNFVQSA